MNLFAIVDGLIFLTIVLLHGCGASAAPLIDVRSASDVTDLLTFADINGGALGYQTSLTNTVCFLPV